MLDTVRSYLLAPRSKKHWPVEFGSYLLVSLIALMVDIGLLYLLTSSLGVHLFVANAVSFIAGATIVYLACIHLIFERRRFRSAGPEFLIFTAIGVVGLGVNELALWVCASYLGWQLVVAKLGAAGASFSSNFILRKFGLFA